MAEFKYEVIERIAVLSTNTNGWEKQLNLISWNEHEPKYDIRDWSPDGNKMGKGVGLTRDELLTLKGILDELEL
ncbi:MAG: PC4/YdbC family ssDNA-binding protein [Gemmiger sp.]|nr:PC4/YdbC family ssDNA-binding protein [Gemmiger sp.]